MNEITDTQRLDFLEKNYVEFKFMTEPHCMCGGCKGYLLLVDEKPYYVIDGENNTKSWRKAIDEAIQDQNIGGLK